MKLTASAVEEIMRDCLYNDDESTTDAKIVEGVVNNFGFHPERLETHKAEIAELLAELPDEFKSGGGGGGWSFLNACMTKDGRQWGEHRDIEALLVLGIATEQANYVLPRDMWDIMPGGMPYFVVNTDNAGATP